MKLLSLIVALLTVIVTAVSAHAQDAKPKAPIILTPAEDVKFVPLDPNDKEGKGLLLSVVFGDLSKPEPTGFFAQLPPGLVSGVHLHKSDYYGIALKGKLHHFPPGKDEGKALENGATWYQAKNIPHNNHCKGPQACLIFLYYPNGFSIELVNESK